jgi:RecB family exonuclease
VHNALAGWWRLPLAQRTVAAAAGLLDRGWIDEGYAGPAQSAEYRAAARGMVERYVATLDPAAEPLGVERTVGTHTGRIVVTGRIDRLDARRPAGGQSGPGDSGLGDSELVVVDYKTGRRQLTPDDARASLSLALYALAAGRIFHAPCRRVELHHLPTGEVHAWQHTPASVDRQVRRAEDIADECRAADGRFRDGLAGTDTDRLFPPRPGPGCGWCDFRAVCPEGAAAAPLRRPWDGLANPPGEGISGLVPRKTHASSHVLPYGGENPNG